MNSKNENVYTTTLFEDVNCNTVLDLEILEYVSENTGARFWAGLVVFKIAILLMGNSNASEDAAIILFGFRINVKIAMLMICLVQTLYY